MSYKNLTKNIVLLLLILGGISNSVNANNNFKIPRQCELECITPYGEVTGMSKSGVKAFSNCNSNCVIFEPNKYKGTYTGIKWQCVEYARRWLLVNHGVVYGDVDIASDIWNKINYLTHVSTNKKLTLKSFLNGSSIPPKVGDLLIYAKAFNETGHVAIVVDIDFKQGFIKVAEQNYSNKVWTDNYSRKLHFIKKDDNYWLLDSYLLGWKSYH